MDDLDQAFTNHFVVNNTYSNQEIREFLYHNRQLGAVVYDNPTAYTYNRINKGMTSGWRPYFEYVMRNTYRYLGPNYNYTGPVVHHRRNPIETNVVAHWNNGHIQFIHVSNFDEWINLP